MARRKLASYHKQYLPASRMVLIPRTHVHFLNPARILLAILPIVGYLTRMPTANKSKVSITIDSDLLEEIDNYAEESGIANRSQVIELWLRQASRRRAADRLAEETVTYYAELTADEARDNAEWADSATNEFTHLKLD